MAVWFFLAPHYMELREKIHNSVRSLGDYWVYISFFFLFAKKDVTTGIDDIEFCTVGSLRLLHNYIHIPHVL